MDLGISGRSAAVAAGSAGLGLGLATRLVEAGVRVVVCGRDEGRLDEALEALRSARSDATGYFEPQATVADLSTPDGALEFIRSATEALEGPPDILVPNNGGPPAGTPTATSIEAFRAAFEANCLASIAMCEAVVPAMRDRGWGRIVGITSIGAREPIVTLAASSVARAALTSYLKMLSTELAPDGITVNNLQPGLHSTDRLAHLGADQHSEMARSVPAGVLGEPDDFGAVGAFLCSRQAAFVTGVGLHVDGGAFRGLQ